MQRLDPEDLGDSNADFAESVAVQGTTLAVGAPSEDDDGRNGDGSVYIFERVDGSWTSVQRDTLCWPYGLSMRGDTLAVADSGNNRVVFWQAGAA